MKKGFLKDVPIETTGKTMPGVKMSGMLADKEEAKRLAKKTGAKILEMPDVDKARYSIGMPADLVGSLCKSVADDADSMRRDRPELSDDHVREALCQKEEQYIKLAKGYPAIFHTFTDRDCKGEERGRMLQVIKLKLRLERGEISRDDSHNLLSDLFGVNEQKRKELREAMVAIEQSQKG